MSAASEFALGVDIGGTTTKVALVRSDGLASDIETFATNGANDPSEFVNQLRCAIGPFLSRAAAGRIPVKGIGIAAAGFLNPNRDRIAYNPNLPWLVDFPLLSSISSGYALPAMLEVDSNAAALGEFRFGAGRGSRRFLCLTAGTGLGGGMLIDGGIVRITGECIGDVGHVIVDTAPGAPACSCGARGCAETMAAAPRFERYAGSGGMRAVIEAARGGSAGAQSEIAAAGRALGIAIASLAQIFFPDRVAIAGGLAEAGDGLIHAVTREFTHRASHAARRDLTIVNSELGWRATVIGAATRFFEHS